MVSRDFETDPETRGLPEFVCSRNCNSWGTMAKSE